MATKNRVCAHIVVSNGPSAGAIKALGLEPACTIGRGRDTDFQVRDRNTSRHHCTVEFDGDYFWLVDEGSANGTLVNDERVRRYMLYEGDRISAGTTEIVFHSSPPPSDEDDQ